MTPSKEFVELDKLLHDRKTFDCGQDELNEFLAGSAVRHRDAGISLTMVLPETIPLDEVSSEVSADNPINVCAYYTLSHSEIKRDSLPKEFAKKLPRYPLPVILIAQLAVHKTIHGNGLGKTTLICALEHALRINQHLPSYAVIVDALNDEVQSFYKQYGFQNLYRHNERMRLYLPMQTITRLFSE
jgi:predicted GNAT family N-acyltransferase